MKADKKPVWDLSILYKSDDDPQIEKDRKIIQKESYKFIDKWKDRTDYLENPKVLREALDEYEKWEGFYGTDGKEDLYFSLRSSQNQADTKIKAKMNKVIEFSQKIENDIQFFTIRLAKVPEKTQKLFLSSPELKDYKHFLEELFAEAKYLLSEPEEKVINLLSKNLGYNWTRLTNSLITKEEREVWVETDSKKLKKEVKNFSELLSLMDSQNKKVRDSAAKAVNEIFVRWAEVAEAELNAILESKKTLDEMRGFDRPDVARHLSDDIETEVVDALVKAVTKRFDIGRRFYKLKAKMLGLKKLEYHERNLPYGNVDKKYSFPDSVSLIDKVMKGLDPKFSKIFSEFIDQGRVDAQPRKGKYSGAFMQPGLKSQPTFILLNHTDKLQDVLTLAHEMGHGIHYVMAKIQNAINYGATTSTTEVASTFMEDFVLQEILKEADDELRLSLMMMKLNDDVSTITRQIACYNLETDLHAEFRKQGYLSKEEIGKIFTKNMKAYMGDSVVQSEGSQNWWIMWTHIRSFFYVYSYASGLLISKSLQASVKKDSEFVQKVKGFFEAGMSESPKNIFKKLGIDITSPKFWDEGLNEMEDLLEQTERLAKKLKKIK